MSLRSWLLFPLAVSPVGGCSDDYSVRAVVIDGRLAFDGYRSWLWQPDCFESIQVNADEWEPRATPAPGDNEPLVRLAGYYWSTSSAEGSCSNQFPVFYGAQLEGRPPRFSPRVAAKPLKVGVVYIVRTGSSGSGSGIGWFKVLPSGRLETYDADPTPTWLDEDGWQINAG